jgi:hypothetical protein
MNDNPRVQQITTLIAVCFLCAFLLFAIIFISGLITVRHAGRPADASTTDAISTAQ